MISTQLVQIIPGIAFCNRIRNNEQSFAHQLLGHFDHYRIHMVSIRYNAGSYGWMCKDGAYQSRGAVLQWLGFVPLLTGLIGWCPLYSVFHIKTKAA